MDKARVTVHEGDGDFDFEEYLRYSLSSSALDGSLPDDQDLMGMNNEIISTQFARSGGYERDLGGMITEMSTQGYESLDQGEFSDDSGKGDDEEGSPMDEAEDGDETEEDDEMDEEEEENEGDDNDEEMDLNNNVN